MLERSREGSMAGGQVSMYLVLRLRAGRSRGGSRGGGEREKDLRDGIVVVCVRKHALGSFNQFFGLSA